MVLAETVQYGINVILKVIFVLLLLYHVTN